jgi:hypothetical protein
MTFLFFQKKKKNMFIIAISFVPCFLLPIPFVLGLIVKKQSKTNGNIKKFKFIDLLPHA